MYPVDLENCGILFCHFPEMESPGNLLKSNYKILWIYKKIFPMARRIDLRMLGMKGYVVKLKSWKNQSES